MTSQNKVTIIGIGLALLLFTSVLTNFFCLFHNPASSLDVSLWVSRIAFWLILLILYWYSLKIEKSSFLLWAEQRKKLLFYVISTVAILAGTTVILTTISLVEKQIGVTEDNSALNKVTAVLCGDKALLVFTCITAAFVEEFIFRGYLLPRLQMLTKNKWIAIFLSSLLFGLAHFGYADLNRMLFPFIIGLIFSFYYSKYGSLSVLIITHFLMDFYSTYSACK